MEERKKSKIYCLCECAILIALSTVLSFVVVYEMPMGGSITLASMLPILFIGVKYGYKWGLGGAFTFSLIQLAQAFIKANVFVYCQTFSTFTICLLFDYLVPFSVLGLSAFAKPKVNKETGKKELNKIKVLGTFGVLIAIRFICHYFTGVVIWGQWAENMSKYLYSLLYNGQYMLPELIITELFAFLIISSKEIKKHFEE